MKTWVFDLDQTLYTNYGIFDEFNRRVEGKIALDLKRPVSEISAEVSKYWQTGRSVYDYMRDQGFDMAETVAHMFAVDRSKFMEKDVELRKVLETLQSSRYVLSDGIRIHAREAISILGIEDLISGFQCLDDVEYMTKRESSTYEKFFQTFNLEPSECIFVDDSNSNLKIGKDFGMTTVHIKGEESPFIDFSLKSIYDIPSIINLV